ncbi:MAG TPA: hypothetical protein VIA18_31465 [Polyangia bacterium]|nr:hypothetical protein [Polyangia bacterium]
MSACGGSSGGGGNSGGGGASGAADLALGAADMTRSTAGIACGPSTACTNETQACCSGDNGVTGTCAQSTAACATDAYHCDGPEDCEPFLPECCLQGSTAGGGAVSQCQSSGYCAMQSTGQLMCHVDKDCGTTLKCCAVSGSPYAFCKTSC